MLRQTILALGLIAMGAASYASSTGTGEFDYAREKLGRIEAVKSEYGAEPLAAIRTVLTAAHTDAKLWRRALAATAFLGKDGLALLLEQLKPMLDAQQYGARAEICLRTVKYIQDAQSMEISLSVLERNGVPPALKAVAADNVSALVSRSMAGSGRRVTRNPDGSITVTQAFVGFLSSRPAYSNGEPVSRLCLLATRQRLGSVLSCLEDREENRCLRETMESTMWDIDKKFADAKDEVPIPERDSQSR